MIKSKVAASENVVLVLKDAKTGRVKQVVETSNRLTTAGLRHYGQQSGVTFGVTPTASGVSFNFVELTVGATIRTTAVGATMGDLQDADGGGGGVESQTVDTNYPTTSDADTDNTGSGSNILSWLRTYTTSQANTNIKAVVINQAGATAHTEANKPTSTNLLLMAATLAVSVAKTSSDTLKVFVNHTFANA